MKFKIALTLGAALMIGWGLAWGEGTLANSYVSVTVGDDHHITLETVGGDPNRTTDDAIQILNGDNTLAIVRVEELLSSDQETSGVSYKVGDDGTAVSPPEVISPNDIEGEWLIDAEIGNDNTRPININVKQKVTVVRDAIRVEYTVKNGDITAHNIGFMQILNLEVPVGGATQTLFLVPSLGIIDRERLISQLDVPSYVRASDDFTNPTAILRATIGEWDATKPTNVIIANAESISGADDPWDYQVTGARITTSAGLVLKWFPRWIQPGESRKFVFYLGVDWSTNDYTYPAGVAIYAPATLQAGTTSVTLLCDLYNPVDSTISGAQASIELPEGLSLASGETQVKTFPDIPPRASATAPDPQAELVWQINIAADVSGRLPLKVSVDIPGLPRRALTRYIDIPVGFTRRLPSGVMMFSAPYLFSDSRMEKVLSDLGDITNKVARWSPKDNRYLFYPTDSQLATIKLGMAYWLKVGTPTKVDVSKSQPQPPTPLSGTTPYSISLDAGWNQIGNPFVYPIDWGSVRVNYGGQVKGWLDAINSGWLRSYIFHWKPEDSSYEWSVSSSYSLLPWEGYFIKVAVPCTLIFPSIPARSISASVGDITATARNISADWLIQLVLLSGNVKDEANYIGVGKELKIEKPPSPVGTYLNIVRDGESLACDVRSSTAQKVWTIEANAPQGGEIIWKGMEKLPKGLRLYIIDENGNRTYMGTTSSYKVEGKRILKIEAVEGNRKAMITGLRVVPQRGGVSIAFSLSAEAVVNARVAMASGKVVKVLGQRSLKEGANSLYWDGKDERGNPLPAGIYIIEVLARGTDGEFSRAIQMFNLR
ncbi:hypothetical protein H5T88_06970 [bacterium]|nr:hypothetical protein [bacterium]